MQQQLRYRWLFTDLDGTLLDQQQQVPVVNREAIAAFRQAGGRIAFATGRIEAATAAYIKELNIVEPCILYNGARVVDPTTGAVLWSRELPGGVAQQVANLLASSALQFHAVYYSGGEACVREITPPVAEYAAKERIELHVDPALSVVRGPVTKVLMIGPEAKRDQLHDLLQTKLDGIHLVSSEPTYLEVLPEGCNKGEALRWLSGELGFQLEETLAIGDNMNDFEMLQTAGLGVAVANAVPGLHAAADAVVKPGPVGGVAEAIERYCFVGGGVLHD